MMSHVEANGVSHTHFFWAGLHLSFSRRASVYGSGYANFQIYRVPSLESCKLRVQLYYSSDLE